MLRGEYFRLLDYRHGPIVVADGKKLVIAAMGPWEEKMCIRDSIKGITVAM